MINQQNAIIKLLIDIRDNKKSYDDHITSFEDEKEEDIIPPALLENQKICDKCGTVVPLIYKRCSKCGNKFE
jgi:predicted Zn-ribbon and HTH transcriptional regulator